MITIRRLDHLVLTVASLEATETFYAQVLGMRVVRFGEGRTALRYGNQKINLHQQGAEFEPKSAKPTPGSADLCFLTDTPMDTVLEHLKLMGQKVEQGPVRRTGAEHPILSVYLRDPDDNLVEVSNLLSSDA